MTIIDNLPGSILAQAESGAPMEYSVVGAASSDSSAHNATGK